MAKKTPVNKHLKFAVLSTDIVCFKVEDGQLLTLLGKVQGNPFYPDHWGVIGGLISPEETAEESVSRLLLDKGGIKDIYTEQLYTFSSVHRDPRNRVVSVAYIGIVNNEVKESSKKTTKTTWRPVENLSGLAYDHDEIIKVAVERLQSRMTYTNIAQYFLPENFTLSDLQKVYETVMGEGIDKRNFRKKILAAKILKDTGLTKKEGVMRPATLYCFNSKEIKTVNML